MARGDGESRLGCGAKFMKFCLVAFNLLFLLLGGLILGVGIYVMVDPTFSSLKSLVDLTKVAATIGIDLSYLDKAGIAFIVFGSVMFVISFLGCCGALKQIRCLLVLYSIFMLILLLAEIGFGIFAAVYASKLKDLLSPALKDTVRLQYYGDMPNKTFVSIAWDIVMYNFECCGATNSTDFDQLNNVWSSRDGALTPRACCKYPNLKNDYSGVIPNSTYYPGCVTNPNTTISNYQMGCYDKISGMVNQYSLIVIIVAIVVGVILALGVLFGFCLCKTISNNADYA